MELKPIRTDKQDYRGNYAAATQDYAVGAESQKVLRNTYLLLALTMVPTIVGAFIGMATAGIILASPILSESPELRPIRIEKVEPLFEAELVRVVA